MILFRSLLALLILLVVLVVGSMAMVLEGKPLVLDSAPEQIDDADTVHELLDQLNNSLQDRHSAQVIRISEPQFDSLVGFVQRASPQFRGKINVTRMGSTVNATLALPAPLDGYFLNVEALVIPNNKLDIDSIRIGNISLPGASAVQLVEWLVNYYTDSDIATRAREQISQVSMVDGELALRMQPLDGFLKQLNEVKNGLGGEQNEELRELTAYYLRYASYQEFALRKQPTSLVEYLRATFARAQQRSTPETAALHNKAAILGLAIFVGHHRIANFVGDVQPDPTRALKPAAPATLHKRHDLAQHFIISAALELLSEQGVSLAIGEFKELMDRAQGGSGYSFVDLTADMSGVEFAKVAGQPGSAQRVQQVMSLATSEDTIIPSIDGVPEGLSKQRFEQVYGKVDSEAYLQEVARIRERLGKIALYN